MAKKKDKADEPVGSPYSIKRRAPRVAVRRRVEGQFADARVFGFTRDIGWAGMFLRTADVLPEGTEVDLQVQLHPDTPPVTVQGRVVRAIREPPESGMAISFDTEGREQERQFIASFVREMELQLKLEQLDEAKRKFLGEVRAFQEDKIALERQRLAFADEELNSSREAHALREELRQLKRSYLDKVQQADERRRESEAQLDRLHRELEREKQDIGRERAHLEAQRHELDEERQRAEEEAAKLRQMIDQERERLLDEMDRERKLHKHLAARKRAARDREYELHIEKLGQRIAALEHVNELLESRARDMENRTALIRSEEAGRVAVAEARIAEVEADAAGQLAQHRATQARLEARIEELQTRLYAAEREAAQERLDAQDDLDTLSDRLGDANAQIERLKREMDDIDEARSQLRSDLNASQERRAELETQVTQLQLELDETRTRLEFRDSMFEDMQERFEEHTVQPEEEEPDPPIDLTTSGPQPPASSPGTSIPESEAPSEPPVIREPPKPVKTAGRAPLQATMARPRSVQPETAGRGDQQHFGLGRRTSHWGEQVAARVAPGSLDLDQLLNRDDDTGDN
jgi:hypothetical protein